MPHNTEAKVNRADAYTALHLFDLAIQDYENLLLKDKTNPEYFFNIGFCLIQQNKNKEAVESFTKALWNEYENIGQLLTFRGIAYNNLKMSTEACADWQKAYNVGFKEAAVYQNNYCK
jgi:tetratricopeptide (TPR) repeat protein